MLRRNKFSLSHYHLTTGMMGYLYPVGFVEVLPGDSFRHQASMLLRTNALIAPLMHPVTIRLHTFYCPTRILWSGWEDFITGVDDTPPPVIDVSGANANIGDLGDRMGIPPSQGVDVNAFGYRMYNKVFNEYYRDQDLVTEVSEDATFLQRVAWGKDYFTAARPWPQKGPSITVPIGTRAPVRGIGKLTQGFPDDMVTVYETDGSGTIQYASSAEMGDASAGGTDETFYAEEDPDNAGFPNIWADLSQADAVDVRDFRTAFALQRYQEARARYGSRFTEYLRYLGIKPSDARLQRPEYLGGGKQTISFSEVLQTAPQDFGEGGVKGVGAMFGHGIAAVKTRRYMKFFEEHGFVMTLASVVPKSIYSQSLHRKWFKDTKEMYYQKELQHVGQQEIYNAEVYLDDATQPIDSGTFAYGNRYSEYMSEPSYISAGFREDYEDWTLAREFASQPTLNASFINCEPKDSIYQFQAELGDQLIMMVNHSLQARRLPERSNVGKLI